MKSELYYLWLNEEQKGPFTLEQLRAMWSAGTITIQTRFWKEGMGQWVELKHIISRIETQPAQVNISTAPPINLPVPASQESALAMIFKLVGIGIVVWIWWGCHQSSERYEDEKFWRNNDSAGSAASTSGYMSETVEAFTTAQLYAERQLKSPSTAKFCSPNEASISHYAGKTVVTGWVDAENSFGAHPRSYWSCALAGSPGNYSVEEFAWK